MRAMVESVAGAAVWPARCPVCSQRWRSASPCAAVEPLDDARRCFAVGSSRTRRGSGIWLPRDARIVALRRSHVRASSNDESLDSHSNSTVSTSESEKDEKATLAAKLAAAEAEAEALKKELALRRGFSKDGDLAKLKPATPDKRIDGTGLRETMFTVPGDGEKKSSKNWGLTEAELFLSKGAPTEGMGLGGPAMEADADQVVTRRLVVGLGLTVVAVALASVKLPTILSKPSKPLFFYLTYILRLCDELESIEATASDATTVQTRLERISGSPGELKDNFLSAAALLEGEDSDRASAVAYEVLDYLSQANSSKYFDDFGQPTSTQQVEFLKFSLESIKAAHSKIEEFLRFVPAEAMEAAKMQLAR